jgi:hypothetical protein
MNSKWRNDIMFREDYVVYSLYLHHLLLSDAEDIFSKYQIGGRWTGTSAT